MKNLIQILFLFLLLGFMGFTLNTKDSSQETVQNVAEVVQQRSSPDSLRYYINNKIPGSAFSLCKDGVCLPSEGILELSGIYSYSCKLLEGGRISGSVYLETGLHVTKIELVQGSESSDYHISSVCSDVTEIYYNSFVYSTNLPVYKLHFYETDKCLYLAMSVSN